VFDLLRKLTLATLDAWSTVLRQPSRVSTPLTTTPSTPSPTPATGSIPLDLERVIALLVNGQTGQMKEMRELVTSIQWGREKEEQETSPPPTQTQDDLFSQLIFDGTTGPLPAGIEAIIARETQEHDQEAEQNRLLQERDVLLAQLASARARVVADPQGPSASSYSQGWGNPPG
jgi:hypothetical protein